ncbi:MAG: hypothetical protein JSW14_01290 [Candidatus Bathyarchaeum sp.]|nr:MAG: hypothetical protein JSW14_01290 [Candidatus Bathyarchaeum sp.]
MKLNERTCINILDSKLEIFIKRGGYGIVSRIKRGKREGKFRDISKASEVTGLASPTIYKILEEHPDIGQVPRIS